MHYFPDGGAAVVKCKGFGAKRVPDIYSFVFEVNFFTFLDATCIKQLIISDFLDA